MMPCKKHQVTAKYCNTGHYEKDHSARNTGTKFTVLPTASLNRKGRLQKSSCCLWDAQLATPGRDLSGVSNCSFVRHKHLKAVV